MLAGVDRLVFCSSVAVYGRIPKNQMLDEETETNPDSPYGESKVLGEQVVMSARHCDGLPVVVARISTVWGPGNASWIGLFRSIASGRFRLIGDGTNRHHIADVSDVFAGSKFRAFKRIVETGGVVRAIPAPGSAARPRSSFQDKMDAWAKSEMAAPGLGYIILERGDRGLVVVWDFDE